MPGLSGPSGRQSPDTQRSAADSGVLNAGFPIDETLDGTQWLQVFSIWWNVCFAIWNAGVPRSTKLSQCKKINSALRN